MIRFTKTAAAVHKTLEYSVTLQPKQSVTQWVPQVEVSHRSFNKSSNFNAVVVHPNTRAWNCALAYSPLLLWATPGNVATLGVRLNSEARAPA